MVGFGASSKERPMVAPYVGEGTLPIEDGMLGHQHPDCPLGWGTGLGAVRVNTAPPWGMSWL